MGINIILENKMGDNLEVISLKTTDQRRFPNRLAVDMQENIHIHFRDIRLEFSVPEWINFINNIKKFDEFVSIKLANGYKENDNHFEIFESTTNSHYSDYGNGVIKIEKQRDGSYHLHYHNLRLELNPLILKVLQELLGKLAI